MELSNRSARELYEIVKADRTRRRFGFGRKPALVNVDLQNAYTRPDEFPTAYETDPRQIEHVNALAKLFRAKDCPVIWTYVAYLESGEDCGVWGTRSDTPDSLQNIKEGSRRAAIDERCEIDRRRHRHQQAHGLGLLRDQPRLAVHLAQGRHRHRDRRLDLGLRARHRGRQPVARLPHRRAGGMRRRPPREPALRQPLRHGPEIRRRPAGGRGAAFMEQYQPAN